MNIYKAPTRAHENEMKQKQDKKTKLNTNTKNMPDKNTGEGHSIERVWYSASREPSDNLLGSQPCTQTHSIYHTPYSQSFRLLYSQSRRRSGSPWVGPINAALNRLKLATVTPGATSTLSAYSASLFLCRCWDVFSSSLTHAAINLQPRSRTVLYQAPGSSAPVLQSPVMPNRRRSSATQSVHFFSSPLWPTRFPSLFWFVSKAPMTPILKSKSVELYVGSSEVQYSTF